MRPEYQSESSLGLIFEEDFLDFGYCIVYYTYILCKSHFFFPDCHQIYKTGNKFYEAVVNQEFSVDNIETCSQNCARETNCKSFSFRVDSFYSSATNCQLTSLDVQNILTSDLNQDSGWNIYEKNEDCNGSGGKTFKDLVFDIRKSCICQENKTV